MTAHDAMKEIKAETIKLKKMVQERFAKDAATISALTAQVEAQQKEIDWLRSIVSTPPEPKKESPYRSGTEYVFQGYGEMKKTTCEACGLDYPVPVSTRITNTCPACGHTNLPF